MTRQFAEPMGREDHSLAAAELAEADEEVVLRLWVKGG